MRTERKLGNKNILVKFDSTFDIYVRKSGKENKNNYVELIRVDPLPNTITINQSVANEYGIKMIINSEGENK